MTQENKTVKWYEVYDIIAQLLSKHYELSNTSFRYPTGGALFNMLMKNSEFRRHNPWIEKFENGSLAVRSIDPVHIFASISSITAPPTNRIIRIKTLLNALEADYYFQDIDFEGCPLIQTTKVISTRRTETQKEIWDFFYQIYKNGDKGLTPQNFQLYNYWYGINLSSFTIFLFWINSEEFLPLDQYVRTFIVSTRLVEYVPNNFDNYKLLTSKISKENQQYETTQYGQNGLFRELTSIAYKSIKESSTDFTATNHIVKLIDDINFRERVFASRKNEETTLLLDEILSDTIELSKLGFRIIALQALDDCNKEYLNILERNVIYPLDNAFSIVDGNIVFDERKTHNLYDIKGNHENDLKINISAIVGQNGSGKSSLIEFLYRIINNISYKYRKQLKTNHLELLEELKAELYYVLSGNLYCLYIENDRIEKYNYSYQNGKFSRGYLSEFTFKDFSNFFYTIAVNYSVYGLNSLQIGDWINELFHKNDSYQAPLVIEPMRTKGNININTLNELVKYRLLGNIVSRNELDDVNSEIHNPRLLTDKQEAISVTFKINEDKTQYLYKLYEGSGYEKGVKFSRLNPRMSTIIKRVEKVFELDIIELEKNALSDEEKFIINETKKYIVKKVVKIARQYPKYAHYLLESNEKVKFDGDITNYLIDLKADPSHVTYKLKQAINFLKYYDLYPKTKEIYSELKVLSDKLDNYIASKKELEDVDNIELLPPPIYIPHIELKDINGNSTSDFEKLSSGEKQRIYTVNSILYHIRNIDSIKGANKTSQKELITYPYINLVLDEIELYHHPEMQRDYVSYLLKMLRQLPLENTLGINICFITHSPFILSDIPKTNILFLDKSGMPKTNSVTVDTFGANIHELLIEGFFMNQTIGDYALFKVKQIIKFYSNVLLAEQNEISDLRRKYDSLQKEFYFVRDNFGEKYIQTTITNHLAFIETKLNSNTNDKN